MRTRRSFGGFFRVVALGCALVAVAWFGMSRLGGIGSSPSSSPVEKPQRQAETPLPQPETPVPQPETPVLQPKTVGFVIPDDARRAEVRWIHDGDSFDVRFLDTADATDANSDDTSEFDEIRLQGLDTPEPGACFADEARDSLIELLKGREVLVHADWDGGRFSDGRDQYFRLIADVWLDDQLVNVGQVARGLALARSSGGAFDDAIASAQQQARDAAIGLWAPTACGGSTVVDQAGTAQLVIVDVVADAPGRDDENPNGEWIELSNTSPDLIDLTGWKLRDESTRNRYSFPDNFALGSGEAVVVRSGCGDDTATELHWCAETPVWTNAGDTAYLVQPDGKFHDVYSYSN